MQWSLAIYGADVWKSSLFQKSFDDIRIECQACRVKRRLAAVFCGSSDCMLWRLANEA